MLATHIYNGSNRSSGVPPSNIKKASDKNMQTGMMSRLERRSLIDGQVVAWYRAVIGDSGGIGSAGR